MLFSLLSQDTSNFDEFLEEPSTGGTMRAAAANAEVRKGLRLVSFTRES